MRINIFTKAILFLIVLTAMATAASAQQVYNSLLSARQMVPVNAAQGTCSCKFMLNAAETAADVTCTWTNLLGGPSKIELYTGGPVGQNGTLALSTPLSGSSNGTASFSIPTLTPQFVADLRANRTYFLLHLGVPWIRGQIKLANGTYNDYDGDGRADLVVYRISELAYYIRYSTGGAFERWRIGQSGDSVSLNVDFDGDGSSDVSTARYNAEVLWRIRSTALQTIRETRWGNSTLGDFFAAGDYDGDGASDIAVLRAGVWYIIESSTGNVRIEYFGQAGDPPAPNDYDKDGKADLTVARSEGGQRVWYTRRSSDGVVTATVWGMSSDAFFTGRVDFDGDGAADLLVIRSQSGQRVFYILRSSDQQMQVIPWGLTSDLPKLGDYDGDGKTDPAVTRAESGLKKFYILESSTGNVRIDDWGLPGDF